MAATPELFNIILVIKIITPTKHFVHVSCFVTGFNIPKQWQRELRFVRRWVILRCSVCVSRIPANAACVCMPVILLLIVNNSSNNCQKIRVNRVFVISLKLNYLLVYPNVSFKIHGYLSFCSGWGTFPKWNMSIVLSCLSSYLLHSKFYWYSAILWLLIFSDSS